MTLRALKYLTVTVSIICCLLGSCAKEAHHDTDHPEHGKIIALTTDWTDRGEGIDIPESYTASIGDYSTALQGTTNSIDNLFAAGDFAIHIYNVADNIAMNGTTATADYSNGLLGWFFTGTENVTVEKDKDHVFTIPMHQQVRQLTLELEITGDAKDRLTGINASLSGVAGAISIDNGNPVGGPITITPVFTSPDCRDAMHCVSTATLRLLGITGNAQTLTLTLHFADGNPSSHTITSDLTDGLAAFNADKKTPLTLSAQLVETHTETGLSSVISDWIAGRTNTGSAN